MAYALKPPLPPAYPPSHTAATQQDVQVFHRLDATSAVVGDARTPARVPAVSGSGDGESREATAGHASGPAVDNVAGATAEPAAEGVSTNAETAAVPNRDGLAALNLRGNAEKNAAAEPEFVAFAAEAYPAGVAASASSRSTFVPIAEMAAAVSTEDPVAIVSDEAAAATAVR